MPFRFSHLEIPDVILIEPLAFEDDRGTFIPDWKDSINRFIQRMIV